MKAKLIISYDGSQFCGFARQKNSSLKSVTDVLEIALRCCGIFSKLTGAGRTDAGVHATRQCVSFELPQFWYEADKLKKELQRKLPDSILIKNCEFVGDDFHPRFGAKSRVYRYVVSTATPNPFASSYVYFSDTIDFMLLDSAIEVLNGTHNFSFFKKSGGNDKETVRTISVKYYTKDKLVVFLFESNGFLRSQIRMLINFLMDIATSRVGIEKFVQQLRCEKKHSTMLAPPSGLYLIRVVY